MIKFDRVVISVNDNPLYTNAARYAVESWHKLFPQVKVCLGLVSRKDDLADRMRDLFDEVRVFEPVADIKIANLAAVARYYLASTYDDDVCMINDIDIMPLQTEYYMSRLRKRKPGELLVIGRGVRQKHPDKFPAGYLTAEGSVWQKVVNPHKLKWPKWVRSFVGWEPIDGRENIAKPWNVQKRALFGKLQRKYFCDESWMRALIKQSKVETCEIPLGYKVLVDQVNRRLPLREDQLLQGNFIEAHHLLPVERYGGKLRAICKYLGIEPPEEVVS